MRRDVGTVSCDLAGGAAGKVVESGRGGAACPKVVAARRDSPRPRTGHRLRRRLPPAQEVLERAVIRSSDRSGPSRPTLSAGAAVSRQFESAAAAAAGYQQRLLGVVAGATGARLAAGAAIDLF